MSFGIGRGFAEVQILNLLVYCDKFLHTYYQVEEAAIFTNVSKSSNRY